MNMKDTDPLDEFYLKLNAVVTNIRALGEGVEESYVVKKLLRAVPNKFLQIASTIEQFENLESMMVEEAIGSLKAHEERLHGQPDSGGNQFLLTEEEWTKREREEGKLLLTQEEWLKRANKTDGSQGQKHRGGGDTRNKEGVRWFRDKSKVRCFNCSAYGHFAIECKKLRREREANNEAHIAQIPDNEPALLLEKHMDNQEGVILINEDQVNPKLKLRDNEISMESNLWYLDNGASNHMTGQKSKFSKLDEQVIGKVKFRDGSMVQIMGNGSITLLCKNGEK
ncbi:uncharacterized protein LOC141691197 [Apium graveolens]|uniref:uncharacterized protein LOC141691197 n=1 Tax=Apium graveolens TaxID=4045 RepID=UPI003D7A8D53